MATIPESLTKELDRLRTQYPNFNIMVEENIKSLEPKQIVKNIVSDLKATYQDVNISLAKNTHDAFAIINVKSKPGTSDLAWYQGPTIGYEGENIYHDIYKHIKNNADLVNAGMRVNDFISSCKSIYFEIYV